MKKGIVKKVLIGAGVAACVALAFKFLIPSKYEGKLVKASGNEISYVKNGKKNPIANADAFTRNFGNAWNTVITLSDTEYNKIPSGKLIS